MTVSDTGSDGRAPPAISLPFPMLLERLRRRASLTQEELAERSGLSVEAISALERGHRRHPRRATLALLADALGLVGGERDAFSRRTPLPRPGPCIAPPPAVVRADVDAAAAGLVPIPDNPQPSWRRHPTSPPSS